MAIELSKYLYPKILALNICPSIKISEFFIFSRPKMIPVLELTLCIPSFIKSKDKSSAF